MATSATSHRGRLLTKLFGEKDSAAEDDTDALTFQALTWHAVDEEEESAGGGAWKSRKYVIRAFGTTWDGRSVCLRIDGFEPFLYVKMPSALCQGPRRSQVIASFLRALTANGGKATHVAMKDFWGFTNGALFDFARVTFTSRSAMRRTAAKLKAGATFVDAGVGSVVLELYEANMDPLLRFIHESGVAPVGWLTASDIKREDGECNGSTCQIDVACDWRSVAPAAEVAGEAGRGQAPLLVAGFDIECNSAHGDFPVACKDYRKLAIDLESAWSRSGAGGVALRSLGASAAKFRLVEAMLFALGHPEAPTEVGGIARLDLKDRSPPAHVLKTLGTSAKQVVDDVFTLLAEVDKAAAKSAAAKAAVAKAKAAAEAEKAAAAKAARERAGKKSGGGGFFRDDEENEEEDTSTLGRLTELLNVAFGSTASLEGDAVIQIGLTVGVVGGRTAQVGCCEKHILVLGTCEPIEGVEVRCFEAEADMLIAFVDLMRSLDPDVVLGYNIFGFDFAYLHERAGELMGDTKRTRVFHRFGRVQGLPSAYVEQKLSSSALGDNVLRYMDMHGRIVVDLLKVVQRDHRLDSYKLDSVAEHFLGMHKHDVSPTDVFRLQRGSAADRRIIAEYCVQDCELCNKLADRLDILINNAGMANVCLVPLSFIFMRGQGVKIFSLVAKRCRDDGFLVPTRYVPGDGEDAEEEEGFEGAIVLDPEVGMYLEDPVSVLDYNSLYPSSMISHNLSHDSLVVDPHYDRLPGVEYTEVGYDRYEGKGDDKRVVGRQVCRFARGTTSAPGMPAVLPRILQDLLGQRKATRKRMQGVQDPFQLAVLDGLQNAYKVTANSLYGQMGARTSPLYLKHIAACTTAVGRSMIMQAKAYVEGPECNGHVVYGDSVASSTPVWVRIGRQTVVLDTVERFAERWCKIGAAMWRAAEHDDGKETLELPDVAVWSEEGWTPAHRLIRHRLAPHKRMMRVATSSGIVDVTDDHSLLRSDGVCAKPTDVRPGDPLLHASKLPLAEMRVLSYVATHVPADVDVCYDASGSRIHEVPNSVVYGSAELQENYLSELLSLGAAGTLEQASELGPPQAVELVFATDDGGGGLLAAAALFAIAESTGRNVTFRVGIKDDGDDRLWMRVCRPDARNDEEAQRRCCRSCRQLVDGGGRDRYVYDFTTESGHFAAGVGRLVVHNTDSIFVVFKNVDEGTGAKLSARDALASSIRQGQEASRGIKPALAAPHNLEYEKTMFPLLLLSKKRYVGLLYEDDPDAKPKQKSMGIALKRRDYAPIVKQIYGGMIDIVLRDRDVPRAVAFLKERLIDLAEGRFELEDLVISKTLRSYYKSPQQIAHWVLARRMYERDPGSAPQVSDRIPYVFIETDKQDALMGDRIEHVDYVRRASRAGGGVVCEGIPGIRSVRVDTKLYIQNQIQKPCLQLLGIALEQLPGYVPRAELTAASAMPGLVKAKANNTTKARERLDTLREREAERLVFAPVLALTVFRDRDNRSKRQHDLHAYFGRSGS